MWELSGEHRGSKGNSRFRQGCDPLRLAILPDRKGISHFWHRIIHGAVDPKCNRAMNHTSLPQLFCQPHTLRTDVSDIDSRGSLVSQDVYAVSVLNLSSTTSNSCLSPSLTSPSSTNLPARYKAEDNQGSLAQQQV